MKVDKSQLFKRAWNLFRSNAKVNTFAEALKKSWSEVKKAVDDTVRYRIADWFMNKNYDKVSTAHCQCYQSFEKSDIEKETEKAFLVKLGMRTKSGFDTAYTKSIWVPKSVCAIV